MKHRAAWITGLFCLLLASGGVWFALASINGIYSYRSPLKDTPPAPGPATGPPTARQVVFVLIDGLRYDTSQDGEVMPNLAGLRSAGASARMTSRAPSYSQPGYAVLLTGAGPDTSDGPAVNLDYAELWPFTQDNLFSAAKRAGLTTGISGYYWFEKLVPQDAVDLKFYTPGEDSAADRKVLDAALPWIVSAQANLVLVHIDQVDFAGHHEGGPRDPRWNAAASRADALLGEILAAVDLTQDAVVVVSDHGHIRRGGHGGHDADVLSEPFVLAGAGVLPGSYPDVGMIDVAPTLAVLLGTNLPASAWGQPLTQMLALDETQERDLRIAGRAQMAELARVYQAAIGGPEVEEGDPSNLYSIPSRREARERLPRLALTAILFLFPLAWTVWKRPKGLKWMAAGGVLAAAVFYLYYTGVEGRALSLSAVDGQGQILGSAALGSLIGLACGALLAGWGSRRLRDPLFWLTFTLTAGYVAALPALWSYLLNGIDYSFTLPEFGSAFVGLLAALQAAFTCLAGLVIAAALALPRKIKG